MTKLNLQLVNTLTESKAFQNTTRGLNKYKPNDLAEMIYIYTVAFANLVQDKDTFFIANDYLKSVLKRNNFKRVIGTMNDYSLMWGTFLGNNPDYKYNDELPKGISEKHVIYNLRGLAGEHKISAQTTSAFLLYLEKKMKITSNTSKTSRRRAMTYSRMNFNQRQFEHRRLIRLMKGYNFKLEMIAILGDLIMTRKEKAAVDADQPPEKKGGLNALTVGAIGFGIGFYLARQRDGGDKDEITSVQHVQ